MSDPDCESEILCGKCGDDITGWDDIGKLFTCGGCEESFCNFFI